MAVNRIMVAKKFQNSCQNLTPALIFIKYESNHLQNLVVFFCNSEHGRWVARVHFSSEKRSDSNSYFDACSAFSTYTLASKLHGVSLLRREVGSGCLAIYALSFVSDLSHVGRIVILLLSWRHAGESGTSLGSLARILDELIKMLLGLVWSNSILTFHILIIFV